MEVRKFDLHNEADLRLLSTVKSTDQGLALIYHRAFGPEIRYSHDSGTWYLWNGLRWVPDAKREIFKITMKVSAILHECIEKWPIYTEEDVRKKREIEKLAKRAQSFHSIEDALQLVTSFSDIAMLDKEFNSNPYLLGVANGTLDLRTGKLLNPEKKHYISMTSPVAFDPKAKSPTWLKFLYEACDGDNEQVNFLKRAVGYSLTGDTIEEKMFILYGPPQTGKTTFLETVKGIMGDYAKQTDISTLVSSPNVTPNIARGDLVTISRARFVCATEGEREQKFATGLLKRLTGRDTISARLLFREPVEIEPVCKIFIGTNDLPQINSTEEALWRRICLVPFFHHVTDDEKNKMLRKELFEELPGILNWALEGCLEWQEEGLQIPESIKRATADLRDDTDNLQRFIKECCIIGREARVLSRELYSVYCKWCREEDEEPWTQKTFIHTLKLRIRCESAREPGTGRKMLIGIGLK
ncbi:MAG: hypothetical protein K6T83_02225 [Alicyclobacillus sp.]|nr:hypothetical protein [Alicyclobacillus sp.]